MFYICRNIFFYLRGNMISKANLIKIEIEELKMNQKELAKQIEELKKKLD